MKLPTIICFVLLTVFCSCNEHQQDYSFEDSFQQSFNIIKKGHVKANEMNWENIEANVKDSIPVFKSDYDVHSGVKHVLRQLDDKHGFFLSPNGLNNVFVTDSVKVHEVQSELIDKNIGYIKLLGLFANDSLSHQYTLKIRDALMEIDSKADLLGWIVDLRDNIGGKLGTIQLGIAHLYTDTIIGYSLNNQGVYISHKILDNAYYYSDEIVSKIESKDSLVNRDIPIAVLVNDKTSSMGESTAISFKFQNNTKIFGSNTAGYTTDLIVYGYVSGARLGFSTAFMCDQNKEPIRGKIVPDVECEPGETLEKAIKWIKSNN